MGAGKSGGCRGARYNQCRRSSKRKAAGDTGIERTSIETCDRVELHPAHIFARPYQQFRFASVRRKRDSHIRD